MNSQGRMRRSEREDPRNRPRRRRGSKGNDCFWERLCHVWETQRRPAWPNVRDKRNSRRRGRGQIAWAGLPTGRNLGSF